CDPRLTCFIVLRSFDNLEVTRQSPTKHRRRLARTRFYAWECATTNVFLGPSSSSPRRVESRKEQCFGGPIWRFSMPPRLEHRSVTFRAAPDPLAFSISSPSERRILREATRPSVGSRGP